ncbi:TMEM30A [Bugula neritina]|uniref:TMEM30A n=1 Tax=Bugula neritina TaxID=10212 RepID=A0A7J7J413_BUGNE|nr:TMEM30A [Bugula neritina]
MADVTAGSDRSGTAEAKKSKKPANTAFKQQRLPAWQPVMTAKSVIPTFFIIGIIFVPIGAVLFTTSQAVQELVIDYTENGTCHDCAETLNTSAAHDSSYVPCNCSLNFTLDSAFKGPVYMYYGLDNFYQNHRRYVKSRDDVQLLGEVRTLTGLTELSTDCNPYRTIESGGTEMLVAPCGAIANSLFNDTLTLKYESTTVELDYKGIAWPTDKSSKFKNPPYTKDLCDAEAFKNTIKPPNWPKHVCELDTSDPDNNGYQNEDLIVWMRNAALPSFRKLYRKIKPSDTFENGGLPAGNYVLEIEYNYPVTVFGGRKKMILSTVSWIGGKNSFLGIAYITVGVICLLLAVMFLVIWCRTKKNQETLEITNKTNFN